MGFALPHPPHSVLFCGRLVAARAPHAARRRASHTPTSPPSRAACAVGAMIAGWGRTRFVRIASSTSTSTAPISNVRSPSIATASACTKARARSPRRPNPAGHSGSRSAVGRLDPARRPRQRRRRARSTRMAGSAPARTAAPARHRCRLQPPLHPRARSRRHPCPPRRDGRRLLDRADGLGSRSADRRCSSSAIPTGPRSSCSRARRFSSRTSRSTAPTSNARNASTKT